METTLPLPFISLVDFAQGPPFQKGITREQQGYLGSVCFRGGDNAVDKLLGFLQRHVSMQAYIDATAITSTDDIISLLNAGAHTVFVTPLQFESLSSYGDRIALAIPQDGASPDLKAAGGIFLTCGKDLDACRTSLKSHKESKISPIFLQASSNDAVQSCVTLAQEHSVIPIIPATQLTMEKSNAEDKLSVPAIIAASWTSDRSDHLIPTLVTDERDIALGLVYSNQESLAESLKTGKGAIHK